MSGEASRISTASFLLPFFGTRLRRQNFNLLPTQYRKLRRLSKLEPIDAKKFGYDVSVHRPHRLYG